MEAEAPKQFDETAVPDKINAHARPSHGLTNPGAKSVKEYSRRRSPLGAPFAVGTSGTGRASKSKRLSATDILTLASMKNAAKCGTWCELQNPVNHRVFERKARLPDLDDPPSERQILRWQTRVVFAPGGDACTCKI
ncbi:Hypothetical predicted protein [Olea europaea subsp. europaea]|uniref:Uncharacterized protein n=1 Tax=Olea europaea subsp. europaea TaxID=158383 RepID=A0A8S0TN42_OLEEU|nr:Hypothetical predicted protein [Olea europaea subsp. europaea]